ALTAFRDHMQAVRERAGDWRLDADGFDALAEGIGAAVAGARKAMRRARADPAPETVHDWRKRVKDHWYHARLLAPLWPVPMDAHARAADRLGELLGQHHDLAVLTARARAEPGPLGDRAAGRKLLRRLVAERQAALEANCFAIGARLLAEPPDALVHRWRAYWKVWRKEEDARVV
ncbi:MAG: CHAD domain-containing protein, partial [Mesorhizobium sp.]|nr:CHAD domain-containing protein [Mesorhizobium sp.]